MTLDVQRFATVFTRSWWLLLVRGLAAIGFGILAWLQPGLSLVSLVLLFGAYCLADGLLSAGMAISGRSDHEDWWLLLLEGLLGVGIGVLTFLVPGLTTLTLIFYIAAWAIGTGVFEIVAAVRLRREIEGEWLLILAGIASLAFGLLLLARPAAGAIAVVWMISAYAIGFGAMLVLLALRLRSAATP